MEKFFKPELEILPDRLTQSGRLDAMAKPMAVLPAPKAEIEVTRNVKLPSSLTNLLKAKEHSISDPIALNEPPIATAPAGGPPDEKDPQDSVTFKSGAGFSKRFAKMDIGETGFADRITAKDEPKRTR